MLSTSSDNNKQLPPSPAPSPISTINDTTSLGKMLFEDDSDNNSTNGISSLLQKFEQPPTKLPSPPESPVITLNGQQKPTNVVKVTQKPKEQSIVNKTIQEIEEQFQTLVDQNNAAEEYIQSLQAKVEKYASDATKVRDYEIRVEYLVTKLEQVTEERDFFEDQLNQLSLQNTLSQNNEVPDQYVQSEQETTNIPEAQPQEKQIKDEDMNDLLNVYEEMSTPENDEDNNFDVELYEQYNQSQTQLQQEEIDHLNDKLVEADKGVQMTLMKYVTDLERQKLETKALKEVVKKQDELITKLEDKVQSAAENSEELLKEQVQVQRIELDNKRELLAQLLKEREDLMKRLSSPRNSLRKSSLEFFPTFTRNSLRPSSYSSVTSTSGRDTPPLTAPPKQPLPPLPNLST